MDELEALVNAVSDGDRIWWPLVALRPAKHQHLSTLRVAVLAAFFGAPIGMLVALVLCACGREVPLHVLPLTATLTLLVLYRFTFAYCWNRRASRLARARALRGRFSGR